MAKSEESASDREIISGSGMEAADVIHLLKLFEQHEIAVVVDGGWGVDRSARSLDPATRMTSI
jgi:hypothetical protein